jgi:hypothetical protein
VSYYEVIMGIMQILFRALDIVSCKSSIISKTQMMADFGV